MLNYCGKNYDKISFDDINKDILDEIHYLFINNNKLLSIDLNIFNNLKVVDLSYNEITEILFLPKLLEELVCNNCHITYICKHDNLLKLHCFDNKLCDIEEYPMLKDLICSNNNLKNIREYQNLESLICMDNPIDEIKKQQNLKILDCSNTLINCKLSDYFPKLIYLYAHNTKISDISNLLYIKEIEACNSHIKNIPYINSLQSIVIDNTDLMISEKYKLKNYYEYQNKIDIIFDNNNLN